MWYRLRPPKYKSNQCATLCPLLLQLGSVQMAESTIKASANNLRQVQRCKREIWDLHHTAVLEGTDVVRRQMIKALTKYQRCQQILEQQLEEVRTRGRRPAGGTRGGDWETAAHDVQDIEPEASTSRH